MLRSEVVECLVVLQCLMPGLGVKRCVLGAWAMGALGDVTWGPKFLSASVPGLA